MGLFSATAHGCCSPQEPAATAWRQPFVRHGFEPSVSLVTDASRVVTGGNDSGANGLRSLLDLVCDIDGDRLLGLAGTRFSVDIQVQRGADGSVDTGDYQIYSNIDGPNRTQVAEFFVEQSLAVGHVRVKVGNSDANTDFAFVENGVQHVHSSFGFAPTILGFPSYPEPAFGGALFVRPTTGLQVSAGVYDGATQAGLATGPRGPRTVFGSPSDLFLVGECEVRWQATHGHRGRAAVGAWRHTGRFETLTATQAGTNGYYIIGEQVVWQPDRADESRSIGAFVQYGYADPDVSIAEHYFGLGATWQGPIADRSQDSCGAGVAMTIWRDQPGEDLAGDFELAAEVFYRVQITPWLHLQPDIQYIRNPGGRPGVPDAWVAMLRGIVSF